MKTLRHAEKKPYSVRIRMRSEGLFSIVPTLRKATRPAFDQAFDQADAVRGGSG